MQLTRRRLSVALVTPRFRSDFEPQKAQAIPVFVFAVGCSAKYCCNVKGNLRFHPEKLYQAMKSTNEEITKI